MRGVAYSAGRAVIFNSDCFDMFIKRDMETEPHRHTETRTQVSVSQLQLGIVRVLVAKVF